MKTKMGVYLDGYFRDKHKNDCKVTMLLDTGNFSQSVMSLKCAQTLGLSIKESAHTATGVDGKSINVIGEVDSVTFRIEQPCIKEFTERFIIIDKMSIPINLSCTFMMKNYIECKHSPQGNVVCIDNFELPMKADNGNVKNIISQINLQSNNTYTFQDSAKITLPGAHNNSSIPVAEIGPQKVSLRSLNTVIIPANSIYTIDAFSTVSNLCADTKLGYIAPKPLGKRNLLVVEGIVPCEKPNFQVNIANYEEVPVTLQQNAKIGFIWKASKVSKKADNQEKITAGEKIERIKFIREKLKVSNISLLDSDVDQKKLINIFLENWDCISQSPEDIGKTNLHTFDLKLLPNTKPFRAKPIRLNPDQEAALEIQVNNWLQQKVIAEGDSPWSHPIFAVRKKAANTGETKLRWVLDFRRLNNVTEKLAAPIPHIGDTLERLGNSKIYSVLDLTAAYHAMSMTEEAGKATAFCTKKKQYIFLRMPFGLTNAPASFCQLMCKVYELNPELAKFSLSYLDDIIVHSNTVEEHFIHLRKVLECLCTAGLKLNIGKCDLFATQVKFLGHCISGSGISMDREYLEKIANWPKPVTGKDIQRYLGFLNYYSTYFQDFAKVTQPLNILRGEKKIEWTEQLSNTFQNTKSLFCKEVSKSYPDWNGGVFILDTDFSSKAFGVVLSQIQNGEEKLINCTSKVCNVSEQNYPSWKGELCALIHAFKRFNYILRFKPFLVRTDSTCLQTYKTWSKLDISGVAVRWILYIQSFDFNIIYRPGKLHVNADYLSRDMLGNKILKSNIESIEGDNNLLDQIYNLNSSVKVNQPAASYIYDLGQRLKSRTWARYTEADDILKQVRDCIIRNLPPNSAELQTLPYRAKQYFKYFDFLKVEHGLVILSQPSEKGPLRDRVCVPIGLYNEVYSYCHGLRTVGHKGVKETVYKINKHFFMPYLQKFVDFSVRNCITCLNRRDKPRHKHSIERSVFSGHPLDTLYVDHIGPLTPSKFQGKTCSYILILVDAYSRFTFAYPVPDCGASTAIDTLVECFVPHHGYFNRIVSDKGSAFTSKVYNGVMEKCGIMKYHIPTRNPQSNFQERYNKNLFSYLKTDLTFETGKWPNKLAYAVLCANTSYNRRLGTTPFHAFHGRDPLLPIDLFNPRSTRFDDVNHKSFMKTIDHIEQGWKQLRDNTSKYLRIQNLHRTDLPLAENTICYIYFNVVRVGVSKKLQSFFLGPMIVTKRYTNSLYLVTPLESCPIKSKKAIVVARDKIYPMETRLELCPKEWISLDLKPMKSIDPDDCILLDKKLFNHTSSFTGSETEGSNKEEQSPEARIVTEESTVDSAPVDEQSKEHGEKQVLSNSSLKDTSLLSNRFSNVTPDVEIDSSSGQRGEGDINIPNSNLPNNDSKSSSLTSDSEISSSSSKENSNIAQEHDISEPVDNNDKDSNVTPTSVNESSIKRGPGRPKGSKGSIDRNKDLIPTRRSARIFEKRTSIKDLVQSWQEKRAGSRHSVVQQARSRATSRRGSEQLSVTENEPK